MSQKCTIFVRSSWAFGNIGDIAITPGMLRLIEQHLPGARIILHPANSHEQIHTFLSDRFPDIELVEGNLGQLGEPMTPALKRAFEEADLYLHASGPTIAYGHQPYDGPTLTKGWRAFDWNATMGPLLQFYVAREMGLPFGGYGIGVNYMATPSHLVIKSILDDAAFFYTRESDSLAYCNECGITPPVMDWVPDCTFAFDMRDEAGADQLMEEFDLEEGKFLVMILRSSALAFTSEEREAKHCYQLRQLIKHWVDRTGLPVFLCPETRKDVEPTGRLLHEPLPAKYKQYARYLDRFWMPDLATSMYQRAHSMVTMDHHSAIMSLSVGTPTLHPRDPMAGRKGQIYNDLNLGDWLFDINNTVTDDIRPALDDLIDNPENARSRVSKAMTKVNHMQAQAMKVVRDVAMRHHAGVKI